MLNYHQWYSTPIIAFYNVALHKKSYPEYEKES